MLQPGDFPDFQGATKLPAVTGPAMKAKAAPHKKKHRAKAKAKGPAALHTRMAKAMEKSRGKY